MAATMADPAAARHIGPGDGTTESQWARCHRLAAVPAAHMSDLAPAGARVVVVAPHPDDEILAAGGLLALATQIGLPVALVAVTDGCASHPASRLWPPERLAAERPRETLAAFKSLGVQAQNLVRLGLPDGGLTAMETELARQLCDLLRPGDTVATTWQLDGHPDHEATGRAAAHAARTAGARCIEAPVWAWHWARPGDARMPWHRARRLPLPAAIARRKQVAIDAFASQLAPDPSTGAEPVLRATTVARAARPFETFFLPE
ncbi:PIG-L deacetylase family protein [Pseudacidovorax sp. RU35E]|uniref:PIG-L deacetylase family protein n=1 Tax=Pseudacidovorax sp. RU35E TaxID=1907403 RepID=UPI00095521B9|nr:PIG-L family deacetylase [Pseudacidovorax sp. RU35E]SIP95602.1 N-acetylglucosaminyl deacetylase, LmbE family [Pseudacidovorax sp. RU35E]